MLKTATEKHDKLSNLTQVRSGHWHQHHNEAYTTDLWSFNGSVRRSRWYLEAFREKLEVMDQCLH